MEYLIGFFSGFVAGCLIMLLVTIKASQPDHSEEVVAAPLDRDGIW